MPVMNAPRPVVILSTADYCAPIWTNKQHIAQRLAEDRDVYYIESLGLREPSFRSSDLVRMTARLGSAIRRNPTNTVGNGDHPAPRVISTLAVPWHRFKWARAFNWLLLKRIKRLLPRGYILWSFSPITYGLEIDALATVYHSVDLLHTLPRIPGPTILRAERHLVSQANAVIASSKGVADHISSIMQGRPLLWENVADVDLFRMHRSNHRIDRAIFVGNLTPTKIDVDALMEMASQGMRLALAGPVNIDGTQSTALLARLLEMQNVEYLGVLTQDEMAQEVGRSRIGLIPYLLNDYTSGVFPMKTYEYLAGGARVVATPLPSLEGLSIDGLTIASPSTFASTVLQELRHSDSPAFLNGDDVSWGRRLDQVRDLLQVLSPPNSKLLSED